MNVVGGVGRFFFSLAVAAFAVQHFIYARVGEGLGPPWTPVSPLGAWVMGAVLLATAVSLVVGVKSAVSVLLLALALGLRFVIIYVPRIIANPRDPGPWTSGFEILAMCGVALFLFWSLPAQPNAWPPASGGPIRALATFLFAALWIVVGVQHFHYAHFVATLVPAWIPWPLFWAYFVGTTFFATALALIVNKLASLATSLLGIMFLLFVLIVHAPRITAALHNANEWTSGFIALAMSGGGLVAAGALALHTHRST